MTIPLSRRIQSIQPSITLAVTARAASLRAQGVDVIGFGAGEPDFDTPVHVKDAAKAALDRGETKYTVTAGIEPLRKAICRVLKEDHGLSVEPAQITTACGAKHALYSAFQVLLDTGDEVIVPAPYWVSYPDMVKLADGVPIVVSTKLENRFLLTPAELERAITPRTRALVLNSPSNPTGTAYSKDELLALAAVLQKHPHVTIISDDIYRLLCYDGFTFHHIAALAPSLIPRTLIIDGLSKSHAMTGWRFGFAAGPANVIGAMNKLHGQSTSNVCSITQAAALAAYDGPMEPVHAMRKEFAVRRDLILGLVRAIPKVTCVTPQGAFYVFPDVSAYVDKRTPTGATIADDVALCDYLLDHGKVAVVPGSGFGAPGFVRLSYATSRKNIEAGVARMAAALAALGG